MGQNVAETWPFSIFNMVAVCHLGFVLHLFGPPIHEDCMVVFVTVQNLVGVSVVVLIFCTLKMPIYALLGMFYNLL